MTKNDTYCWICGNKANSREHRIKRSDIKQLFGEASQSKPLYINDANAKNKIVQSSNAKFFKSEKDLCSQCNNKLTQPYDKAWETLSAYLHNNWSGIIKKNAFRMSKAFPSNTSSNMLGVHLFFSKVLGCSIKEGDVSLDTKKLADGIKEFKAVPNFWIAIGQTPGSEYAETVSRTDLMVAKDNKTNKEVAATQIYTCGEFSVHLVFSLNNDTIYDMSNKWHPLLGAKIFNLSDLSAEQ